jgi:DNA polymerase III gamma/tau subunit
VKSLKNIIKSSPKDRPHSFLLTGERGTGKTTTARILAREFGCSPIDYEELNGSDNRGIDDVRRIIDNAQVSPMGGTCRVFVWDECHQITKDGQNALLKIIEDTPITSYFILCSTEPSKILKTIKSRCTFYQFELLADEEMAELVDSALKKIGQDIHDDVFDGIVHCSDGSPREALVLLEQVLTLNDKDAQLSVLKKATTEREVIDICRILIKGGKWSDISEVYKGLVDPDSETVRRAILGYMKTVLLGGQGIAAEYIALFERSTFDSGSAGLVRMLYDASNIKRR